MRVYSSRREDNCRRPIRMGLDHYPWAWTALKAAWRVVRGQRGAMAESGERGAAERTRPYDGVRSESFLLTYVLGSIVPWVYTAWLPPPSSSSSSSLTHNTPTRPFFQQQQGRRRTSCSLGTWHGARRKRTCGLSPPRWGLSSLCKSRRMPTRAALRDGGE